MARGAGKLMEVIAMSGRAASARFLKGLYALNGETLGGLVPLMTGSPAEVRASELVRDAYLGKAAVA